MKTELLMDYGRYYLNTVEVTKEIFDRESEYLFSKLDDIEEDQVSFLVKVTY